MIQPSPQNVQPAMDTQAIAPSPVPQHQAPVNDISTSSTPPPDTRAVRELAAENSQWSYLAHTEPIFPLSSTAASQSELTPPEVQHHSPDGPSRSVSVTTHKATPTSPSLEPLLSEVDPWMLPSFISSRPTSPLFHDLSFSFDIQGLDDALKTLEDSPEHDDDNNVSFLRRLYNDDDLSQ